MKVTSEKQIRRACSDARQVRPGVEVGVDGFLPGVYATIRRVRGPAGYVVEIVDPAGVQRKRFGNVGELVEARRVGIEAGSLRLTVGDDEPIEAEVDHQGGPRIEPNMPAGVALTCDQHAEASACSTLCFEADPPDPADRAAWLEWRRAGLGGSDVAAILDLSPWSGPFDVWLSKTEGGSDGGNASTKRGQILESAILQHAADELGARLLPGEALAHPDRPWHRATPDGYLETAGAEVVGIEGKSTRAFDEAHGWGEAGTNEVPLGYRIQCHWYMGATGLSVWYLAAFATLTDEFRLYRIESDPKVEQALVERAGQWWRKHIENGEPPALDTSDACGRYLHAAHTPPGDEVAEADADQVGIVEQWRLAKEAENEAREERKRIEVELKAAIGDAAGLRGEFGRVKWSRFQRSSLDAKRLRAERPDLAPVLDAYTKTSPSSRISAQFKTREEQP
jgi:putative phage-type endonuclease